MMFKAHFFLKFSVREAFLDQPYRDLHSFIPAATWQAPLTVTLGESNVEDYGAVLTSLSAKHVDAEAIYALHSQLSPADLKASVARVLSKGDLSTEALVSSIRDELVSVSAVAPEEVEPVDLADFPGLEGIKEELERNVLFPLENPDQAKEIWSHTQERGAASWAAWDWQDHCGTLAGQPPEGEILPRARDDAAGSDVESRCVHGLEFWSTLLMCSTQTYTQTKWYYSCVVFACSVHGMECTGHVRTCSAHELQMTRDCNV